MRAQRKIGFTLRALAALGLAVLCAAAGTSAADTAKAKAANTRGFALHKQKSYKAAAVEYRKAIAEDPSYLLPHYNLACVASLTKDADTARAELAWVFDRATWDSAAKTAVTKASKDRDLAWILDNDEDARSYANPTNIETLDLLAPECCFARGKPGSDPKVAQAIAAASGAHAPTCSAAAFSFTLDSVIAGKGTVAATLRDGVALLDAAGQLVARSEPLGCGSPQDQLALLNHGQAVPSPYASQDTPLLHIYYVVVAYGSTSKQSVAIFAIRNHQLLRVFDGVTRSDAGLGHLTLTPLGNLVYTAPGERKPRIFRWDPASSKLAPADS